MSTRKALSIVSGLVLGLAMFAPVAARADETNQSARFTFNRPVEVPGNKVLPAGTYWFKLLNAPSSQNIVQIFNAKRTKVLDTYTAMRTTRDSESQNPELKFAIPSHNRPMILQSWFYPDRLAGHESPYSSRRESQMSEEKTVTVMAHPVSSSQSNSLYAVNVPHQKGLQAAS